MLVLKLAGTIAVLVMGCLPRAAASCRSFRGMTALGGRHYYHAWKGEDPSKVTDMACRALSQGVKPGSETRAPSLCHHTCRTASETA